jgi:hypothetical protein
MNQFEVQVLDSYKAETYADGQAGSIYGQFPPLANAARPPGEWQSYDIAFRRPRFDGTGRLLERARITVFHNGILVQNNEEPFGPTSWLMNHPYKKTSSDKGPIQLQDHSHPVRYRNFWLRELPERPAPTAEVLAAPKVVTLSQELLDRYAGRYRMGQGPRAPIVVIAHQGDHLTATFPSRPGELPLIPTSETEFEMTTTDGAFTFKLDAQGKPTGARFRIGDGEREMERANP